MQVINNERNRSHPQRDGILGEHQTHLPVCTFEI